MNTFQPAGIRKTSKRKRDKIIRGAGRRYIILAVISVSLCLAACSQKLDTQRFSNIHGAARAIDRSLSGGASFQEFSDRVLQLSEALRGLRGVKLSDKERELLKKYADLLAIYKDGLLLWKYKREGTRYHFIPAGVIYVGQDVEPVVEKYRFSTESHVYAPTKQVWKSIPGDSLNVIWQNADSQLAIIEAFPKY